MFMPVANGGTMADRFDAPPAFPHVDAEGGPRRPAQHACPAIRRAIAHVLDNYARPLPLRELATLAGMTIFRLIRAFHRATGFTPHAFILRVRVARGTAMLLRGEPPVAAALAVGFVDQAHFNRHFKRTHGMTPTQFLADRPRRVRCDDAAGDRYAAAAS